MKAQLCSEWSLDLFLFLVVLYDLGITKMEMNGDEFKKINFPYFFLLNQQWVLFPFH